MGGLTIIDCEQRSDEWFEARRGIVTASTIKGLLTPTLKVADNDTSRSFVRQIVAERITGLSDPGYMNDDMWRGVLHEPFARDAYAKDQGVEVAQMGFMVREDRCNIRLGYSPDGLVGDDGLIEIKCPRPKEHVRTILEDAVPDAYMAQCQAALFVSGREWIDYVSFVAGMPLWTKRVRRDAAWHDAIGEAVEAFEQSAESLISRYLAAVEGLPMTEPIPDLEVVI